MELLAGVKHSLVEKHPFGKRRAFGVRHSISVGHSISILRRRLNGRVPTLMDGEGDIRSKVGESWSEMGNQAAAFFN